uniref:Uncharacterized protein n=1 Tax=Panagrolaimus davidi TaxID=227884 RepID=A0A914RDF3_9BILA
MKADDSIKTFAGLSDQKLSSRHKRDFEIVCKANDKIVPCDQWEKKCFLNDKVVACNEDHKCYHNSVEYPCHGNDKHICKLNGKEIPCDGTSKTCYSNRREVSCDAPDENDVDANTKVVENGGNGVAASIKESKTPDENASVKFGNGFALIIASFFGYLFFH